MSTNSTTIPPLIPCPDDTRPPNDRLLELIPRALNLPPGSISEASDMHNTRHWDSLRHVLLMIEIEQAFGLRLSDLEMASAISVAEIRRLLREHGRV
jgi:acyl carrier protein